MTEIWLVLDVNAEPWAIGPLGVKRTASKIIPFVGPNKQTQAFQNAVREQIEEWRNRISDGTIGLVEGDVELDFWIWRRIDEYQGTKRKARAHRADATNIQKALEDSLQKVLIDNDRAVRRVQTHIVEQSTTAPSRIIMRLRSYQNFNPDEVPEDVWAQFDKLPTLFDERRTAVVERVEDHF